MIERSIASALLTNGRHLAIMQLQRAEHADVVGDGNGRNDRARIVFQFKSPIRSDFFKALNLFFVVVGAGFVIIATVLAMFLGVIE